MNALLAALFAAAGLGVAAAQGHPQRTAPAHPRHAAAALPPSKQSSQALAPIWLCGTVTQGGSTRPLRLGIGSGVIKVEVSGPAVIRLRRQSKPCEAGR